MAKKEQLMNKTLKDLENITKMLQRRDILLGVLHSIPEKTNVRNVIIEGAPHEHKMAGKGQITSERGRKRTRTSQRAPQ
jgi:ribosomal protein S24E